MQSFSLKAKTELCRLQVQRPCCSRAESYGVLLYCNTFTTREVRIITENPEFALRLPRLFHKAFGVLCGCGSSFGCSSASCTFVIAWNIKNERGIKDNACARTI